MALSALKDKIVTTATGASDSIFQESKESGQDWTLFVSCGTWGDADLQASADGVNWGDAKDAAGVVNFVENGSVRVPGNCYYRLNVTTHSAVITLIAK